MSITTASLATRTIVTSTSEQKVVQVMSDVWESFTFFTGTEIVNGELVSFDEMARGQEKPVVNATEADLTAVRKSIVKTLLADLITIDVSLSGKVVDLVQTGALVQVVKGRKVPVGTSGTVMKQGVSQFGRWVLILNENGNARTFVSLENLKVIDPLFNTYTPVEDPAVYENIFKPFTTHLAACTGTRVPLKSQTPLTFPGIRSTAEHCDPLSMIGEGRRAWPNASRASMRAPRRGPAAGQRREARTHFVPDHLSDGLFEVVQARRVDLRFDPPADSTWQVQKHIVKRRAVILQGAAHVRA
jgi:hypothetical protein